MSSTQEAAIEAYLGDTSITATEAQRRLTIQDRINALTEAIEAAIDVEDFAGIWIDDNDGGRAKIGIETALATPPASKTEDAQQVLDDHAFTEADFVAVNSSVADLDAAVADLEADVDTLVKAGKVTAEAQLSTNSVVVERITGMTSGEISSLNAAIDDAETEHDVDIDVNVVNETTLRLIAGQQEEPTCGLRPAGDLICSVPYRGGTYINDDSGFCTGGFLANSNSDEKLYLMTAGHCVDISDTNHNVKTDDWYSYSKINNPLLIGKPWNGSDTSNTHTVLDAGIITVNDQPNRSVWWNDDPVHYIYVTRSTNEAANTTRDEFYEITDVKPPSEKSIYCMTGAPRWSNGRHTMCGRVKQRSTRRHAEGDGITPRRGLIRIDVCGPGEGSSGGPLYKNHTGYGLFVLYSDGVCHKYFTRLDFAESALHVHVVPE